MATILSDWQRETVVANVPLVEHIVNRIASSLPASYSRDDLVQTGILGLISATTRYNPDTGVAFSTFAGRRIEGAVIDLLRSSDWAPRSVRSMERKLQAAEERIGVTSMRADAETLAKLAQDLECKPEDLQRLRQDIGKARLDSLDRPIGSEGSGAPLADSILDQTTGVDEIIDNKEMIGYLRNGVALLPERHRLIVIGYFFHDKSITELGALIGVTQSRASQIKDEALKLLRQALKETYPDGGPAVDGPVTSRQRVFAQAVAKSEPFGRSEPRTRQETPT